MDNICIDGKRIKPIAARSYQELIKIELRNDDIHRVFPFKPDTPRYAISVDNIYRGYYKMLSSKAQANNRSSILSLHKQ